MDLAKLFSDFASALEALKQQLADAQAALDQAKKASYDQGFADGVASVVPSDKVFSQAEVDAMKAGFQSMIDGLNGQIDALNKQVMALQASIDQAVADGVAKAKADVVLLLQGLEDAEKKDIEAAIALLSPAPIPEPVPEPIPAPIPDPVPAPDPVPVEPAP